MRDRFVVLVTTFFYVGRIPWAPGTCGSAAGLLLFWALDGAPLVRAGVFLFLLAVGLIWGGRAEKIFHKKDPSCVVIDEVVGIFPAFFLMPPSLSVVVIGFIVYRIVDITKPFPMRRLERLPAGWGIMADDLMGGVTTWALLWVLVASNVLR